MLQKKNGKKKIKNSVPPFEMAVMEKKLKKKVKPVSPVRRRQVSGKGAHSRHLKRWK